MIRETVTVGVVEEGCIWVEASPKTTCGSCTARQGCGQRLLGKLMARPNLIPVPLAPDSGVRLQVGDQVEVGVPEDVLVSGSLLLYMVPLLSLLLCLGVANGLQWSEWQTAACGLAGLLGGAWVVRYYARRRSRQYSPVFLGACSQ